MLRVTIIQNQDGDIESFEAEGHTALAPPGYDVACAGASSVIQTAVIGLTRVVGLIPGVEQESGHLYVSIPAEINLEEYQYTQIILKTMLAGLEEIKKQYPSSLKIRFEKIK